MKQRIIAILMAAVMLMPLAGCGRDENAPRYAYVGLQENETRAFDATLMEKMASAAKDNAVNAQNFPAETGTNEALNEKIDAAKKAGAKLILGQGKVMEMPFYRAQNKYHRLKFVLFEGVPRGEEAADGDIRTNTMCIDFAYEEEGFICGYAAVYDGNRNLAYMAGEASEQNYRYLNGFIQGAHAAAAALNCQPEAVSITALFAGTEELTPRRMSDAMVLCEGGVELVFSVGENVTLAVDKGLYADGRARFITAGQDMTSTKGYCQFSILPNVEEATGRAIAMFENGSFRGGEKITLGLEENCLMTVPKYDRMKGNFTEEVYNELVAGILAGSTVIDAGTSAESTELIRVGVIENTAEEELKLEDVLSPVLAAETAPAEEGTEEG